MTTTRQSPIASWVFGLREDHTESGTRIWHAHPALYSYKIGRARAPPPIRWSFVSGPPGCTDEFKARTRAPVQLGICYADDCCRVGRSAGAFVLAAGVGTATRSDGIPEGRGNACDGIAIGSHSYGVWRVADENC